MSDAATMRILIAPDSFKESMTAAQAAEAIARGVRDEVGDGLELDLCPMADGGEGTVEALVAATGGRKHTTVVTGPLGTSTHAEWGTLGDGTTAVVEMAQAAGLVLVPPAVRDPTRTTTYGVGELIAQALNSGARKLIIGIGGSATVDGGAGMAQALGVRFSRGAIRDSGPLTGGELASIRSIDITSRDPRIAATEILVACDVTNPLYGPEGAAAVYGPQKGATPEQVKILDAGLRHLASLVPQVDPDTQGVGAAGGLGFGLVAFCSAKLVRGVELVLEAVRFDQRVRGCDLVLTGEGRLDGQSIRGKTCIGVAQAAARHGVPTIALVGSLGPQAELTLAHGLAAYHAILDGTGSATLEQALQRGPELLEKLTAKTMAGHLT